MKVFCLIKTWEDWYKFEELIDVYENETEALRKAVELNEKSNFYKYIVREKELIK